MGTWLVALAAVVTVTGCGQTLKEFACGPEKSCGPGGTCETAGFCSFEDSSCPSGRRYGDLGGPSGDCTPGGGPQQQVDAAIDGPPDGRPDAPPDAMEFCYGAAPFTICLLAAPTKAIDIEANTTFDTVTGISVPADPTLSCAQTFRGGAGYCVLVGTTITLGSGFRATGANKPLVLLASDTINISATLDVASHRTPTETIGAGGDPGGNACAAGTVPVVTGNGGGAGGSFNGTGGAGGAGGAVGATGGTAGSATAVVNVIRGGCPGQDGAGANKGLRGHGGGAVFLIAGNSINVSSTINAGGEGGGGASPADSGGGGGGAGGMIGFDALNIAVSGIIIANGGSGGEGSGTGSTGSNGTDSAAVGAAHTNGNSGNGGDGGDGSAGAAAGPGTKGADGNGGGGGGGGGAGFIKGPAAKLGNNVSPAATK
jgi:hypothetical protein